ncbi:SDR family NAD(P)-dependent oxidoreductase [Nocardia sp. CA-107356]|uniref:SDR family NAD(P)-dependent oxidoreductase n=1 Tax=Nocardia sp. CA-107356 TaxID=3239972 RepID=UPI003D8C8B88
MTSATQLLRSHWSLTSQVILVTGAASGIGAACAELAAGLGATVMAVDRDHPTARHDFDWHTVDLTQPMAGQTVVSSCLDRHGCINGLVNAAGVLTVEPWDQASLGTLDEHYAINCRAPFALMMAAAPHLGQGDSIVNIASITAQVPRPDLAAYASSKSALVSLTNSAAAHLAPRGIRVNAVLPGTVDTPMAQRAAAARSLNHLAEPGGHAAGTPISVPLGRNAKPSEVATVVCFLLSNAASYITGEAIRVTGGANN